MKIDSLAMESRLLRARESSCIDRATSKQHIALGKNKGLRIGDEMPKELQVEIERRVSPMGERLIKDHATGSYIEQKDAFMLQHSLERVRYKTIRKFLRAGMTKEEILALPGVRYALKERARATSYHAHRIGPVRNESRHAQLALVFLRGKEYRYAEDRAKSCPNWDKIQEIATRFSREDKRIIAQRLEQWAQEGKGVIEGRKTILRNSLLKERNKSLH